MSHQTHIQTNGQRQAVIAPEFASILIVDDEEFDRTRLKKLCRGFDFTTHVAEAGGLAGLRDQLSKDRFDLVLLDYHLNDGTGLEGVEIIRADPMNCAAATVMITGTEQYDIAIKALKLGFTDYLTKDEISAETLGRAAISALQKSQMARALSTHNDRITMTDETVQSFSRGCAQDIKPIVSRIMRQMRGLREGGEINLVDAQERVEQVEASLRRLWGFLDDLDMLGGPVIEQRSDVAAMRGNDTASSASVTATLPSARQHKPKGRTNKSPSIFRRSPD